MKRMLSRGSLARLSLLILALTLAGACTRVAPVRTLPSWVRGIYVPVLRNKSYEPGLEIPATRAIQDAFLEDGRIDIVPKEDADLVLVGTITDYGSKSAHAGGDHIASDETVTMGVDLELYEPPDMTTPLAKLPKVLVNSGFQIDVRSVDFIPEPDRIDNMMASMAGQVLSQVINGFPIQLQNVPPGALLPQITDARQVQPGKPLEPRLGADQY